MARLRKNEYTQEIFEICKLLQPESPEKIRSIFLDRIDEKTEITKEFVEKDIKEMLDNSSTDRLRKLHRMATSYVDIYFSQLRETKENDHFYATCEMIEDISGRWDSYSYGWRDNKHVLEVKQELKLISKKDGTLVNDKTVEETLEVHLYNLNIDRKINKLQNKYYGLRDVHVREDSYDKDKRRALEKFEEIKGVIKDYRAKVKAKEVGFDLTKLDKLEV